MPEVKAERTGWRDPEISGRHRMWGFDCPAADVDWIEYNHGVPVAMVEYKHEKAKPVEARKDWNLKAFVAVATSAQLPAFIVRYAGDFTWWKVRPLNALAQKTVRATTRMDERTYVAMLYKLRGLLTPEDVLHYVEADGVCRACHNHPVMVDKVLCSECNGISEAFDRFGPMNS